MSHGDFWATHLPVVWSKLPQSGFCNRSQLTTDSSLSQCQFCSSPRHCLLAITMQSTCLQSGISARGLTSVSRNTTHPKSFSSCNRSCRSVHRIDRRIYRINAQQQQQEKPAVAKFADSVGLPTEEGLFGFKPFPEVRITRAVGLAPLARVERVNLLCML